MYHTAHRRPRVTVQRTPTQSGVPGRPTNGQRKCQQQHTDTSATHTAQAPGPASASGVGRYQAGVRSPRVVHNRDPRAAQRQQEPRAGATARTHPAQNHPSCVSHSSFTGARDTQIANQLTSMLVPATPRALHRSWTNAGATQPAGQLQTVLCTSNLLG